MLLETTVGRRPWLLLRRCNLSNIGDHVRAGPSNAENNTNPNPDPNILGHLCLTGRVVVTTATPLVESVKSARLCCGAGVCVVCVCVCVS